MGNIYQQPRPSHLTVMEKYKEVKAMKDAITEKTKYYDTDNSRLRRRVEKARRRMTKNFRD
jgi:hypothetical protein